MPASGPIILDLLGPELTAEERDILQHPLVAGVILFGRHYQSPEQISELCRSIRLSRSTPLLITVDHEGGRVQRFKEGFTQIPSMGKIGELYQTQPEQAQQLAETCGWLIATELLAVGVDLSFAPVLDVDKKINPAIGDRAFAESIKTISILAKSLVTGMHNGGMKATGKHFPGHGSVTVDSHLGLPIDTRSFNQIFQADLTPFINLIASGIDAIMASHILFPAVDSYPAGFSHYWLQDILRKKLGFSGVIISDDLNMKGADISGYAERAKLALDAGCDLVLICNNRAAAIEMLDHLPQQKYFFATERLQGRFSQTFEQVKASSIWRQKHELIKHFSTQETI